MFGVVLWSDPCVSKAVIWCEDHGDLAFLNGSIMEVREFETQKGFFDAGDYVQFDLTVENDVRRARNAKIVHVANFADPADTLAPSSQLSHSHPRQETTRQQAEVIRFPQTITEVSAYS